VGDHANYYSIRGPPPASGSGAPGRREPPSLSVFNPTREAKLELCIGAALSLCCKPSDYHKHLAGLVPE